MNAPDDPLAGLERTTFVPFVGRAMKMTGPDGATFDVTLEAADDESRPDGRHGPRGGRAPFSLTFEAADGIARPQGTYTIALAGTTLPIFCVPVIGDDATPRLQATFN